MMPPFSVDEVERAPSLVRDWGEAASLVRTTRMANAATEAPFVGREQLLQHMYELADVARGGHGVVVALAGEAGIGKTRLLRECARRGATLGFHVDWIADSFPLQDTLAGVAGRAPMPTDEQFVVTPPLLMLIRQTRGPRLLVIDDALSADRLADLAALAAAGVARLPALVLLGLSPEFNRATKDTRRLLAALARQRVLTQVTVPPLGEAELFELASNLLGGRPDPRLQATISSLSEGNPFFVEELVADLAVHGHVRQRGHLWSLSSDLPADYTPRSVATMLGHVLKAVDSDVMQTLASAAMLGPGFQFGTLEATTARPPDRLLADLEAGLAFGILREAVEPPDDFQFTHELVRRALRGGLSQARRRRLQRAVANAPGGQHHQHSGGDRASDGDGGRGAAGASDALARALRSLEHAERLCSWEEAIRQCRTALDLTRRATTADPVGEIQLLDRLAALYFGRVQTFAAGACLREAVELCEAVDLPLPQVVVMARLAALGPSWYSIETAEARFEQHVRSSPTPGASDRSWLFDAHLELGFAHQRYGRLARAVGHVRSACDIVEPTDWPRHTLGLFAFGALLTSTGDIEGAITRLRAVLSALDAGMAEQWSRDDALVHWRDPRRTRCLALAELARALDLVGRTGEAERFAEAAREEEIRFGILGGRAHRALAQVELRRGRPEAALRMLSAKADEAAPGSLSMRRAADLVLVSAAHLACGNVALALETASEGVSICLRSGAGESLAGLHVATARAHLALGHYDGAREAVAAAHGAIDEFGTELYRRDARAVSGEIRAASAPSPVGEGTPAHVRGNAHGGTVPKPDGCLSREETARGRPAAASPVPVDYVRGRSLTIREREILSLMAVGETNRRIAVQLGVSDKTVKRHVSNIFNKLAANTRAMAVRRALESGILKLEAEGLGDYR